MIKLMETLFIVSLYGSLLVMLILLVKILLKEKLNPKFHYYIWVLLIIKLIVPYGLKSNFSVFNLMNPIMEKREITKNSIVKAVPNSIPIVKNEDTDSSIPLDTIGEISKAKSKVNYKVILLYIWFIGMTGILAFILHGVWKIKCIKRSAYNKEFQKFNKILNDCLHTMNIKKGVKLLYTDKISSPCIWGFIKPVIFMPINVAESISEEEFKYTLLHELVHLKRKDILINWIIIFLNTIYWFNPVIRYGFYKMKQDCEISCDAYALTYLNEEENLDYGNSIIKILQLGDQLKPLIGTTSMISNKSEIKRRIIMVSKFKKLSWKGILFGLSVIIIIGTVGLTNPVSKASTIDIKIDNWNKTGDDETILLFKDKNIEDVVRAKINKPNGNLLKSDVLQIEELTVTYNSVIEARIKNSERKLTENEAVKNYEKLGSLEGIEYLTNLKSLNLTQSFAPDLSPLKSLSQLRFLNISKNYMIKDRDIYALRNLVNLEELDISCNKIKDLRPLSNMKKLKKLNLHSNAFTDLSPIGNLNQLEEINLNGSLNDEYNKVTDVSVLKNLKNLKTLDILFNPIDENQINDLKSSIPNCNIKHSRATDYDWNNDKASEITKLDYLKKESKAQIASLEWTGYKDYWSGCCKNNIYTAEFKIFRGTERYVIKEKEADYNLKIDSNINEGSLTIKVYTDKKIIFEKNNPKEESMRISKEDAANIKIECIGADASGCLKFEVN